MIWSLMGTELTVIKVIEVIGNHWIFLVRWPDDGVGELSFDRFRFDAAGLAELQRLQAEFETIAAAKEAL